MKSISRLTKRLNQLNLSYARKADLISKYKKADPILTKEMNEYFGIKAAPPRKKAFKKNIIKKRKLVTRPRTSPQKKNEYKSSSKQKTIHQYSKTNKQTYRGSHASVFDHKARPTPDLHLEADKLLDKEYLKNS